MSAARATRLLLTCALLVAAAGCSLAPRYERPAAPDIAAFKEAPGEWLEVQPQPPAHDRAWWQAFGDPQLDTLQAQLADGSQDLKVAAARYSQARAYAQRAGAARLPTLDATVVTERRHISANAPGVNGSVVTYDDHDAGLQFAWEIDLFGKLRNASLAAERQAEASAADLGAARLALGAELARDYFALRGADATLALLEDTATLYRRALDLTRNRYAGGIAAATDVDQAQTQLQTTLAQLAAVRLQRAELEHAIAVLLGRAPAQFALAPAPFIGEPPAIAPQLPAELLLRRPDIASAERAVAAANAEIGVARAAWFPVFSLRAAGGYEATASQQWFEAPSRYWAIGPAAALSLLDFGAKSGGTHAAQASFDIAAANYRQTVLVAYQEVEDQLAALRHLADELAAQEAASASARSSAYHAGQRYEAGVADYIEVTTTQSAALQAQRAALDARVRRMTASVALLRALGGDWQDAPAARTVSR